MQKITTLALVMSLFASILAIAAEVNLFNAWPYKADGELYATFTTKTVIQVNLLIAKYRAL